MNKPPFRWGIIGTGKIAHRFASGLPYSEGARLLAVGSRTKARAEQFAAEFKAEGAYGSYEELANDPDIDAIYIATPHPEHITGAKLSIEHGKPVLVEKPFTLNAPQAKEVVELARSRGVFCMEAMWMRFFPAIRQLRKLVGDGGIGAVKMIQADFGFRAEFDPQSRLFNPALGGGGLLDVGVYPISFSCMLLGVPSRAEGFAQIGPSGVDHAAGMILQFLGGEIALLSCGVALDTPHQAIVLGEAGSIHLHSDWWKADGFTVRRPGKPDEVVDLPYPGTGFQFEADEVRDCVRAGKLQSDVMPLDETVVLMELLDHIRNQWGVKYPGDV